MAIGQNIMTLDYHFTLATRDGQNHEIFQNALYIFAYASNSTDI